MAIGTRRHGAVALARRAPATMAGFNLKSARISDELLSREHISPHIVGFAIDFCAVACNQAGGSRPGTGLLAVLAAVIVLED